MRDILAQFVDPLSPAYAYFGMRTHTFVFIYYFYEYSYFYTNSNQSLQLDGESTITAAACLWEAINTLACQIGSAFESRVENDQSNIKANAK